MQLPNIVVVRSGHARRLAAVFLVASCLLWPPLLASSWLRPGPPESAGMSAQHLARLDGVIQEAIGHGETAGAVALVARRGVVVFRKAYGHRALTPSPEPMEPDTIFDMASLTKVMAATPAVMMLAERGQIRLADSFTQYLKGFAPHGKGAITLRQMLTHYSGLRPDVDLDTPWTGYQTAIELACQEKLSAPPGESFIYSDINFFLLGDLVGRVTGRALDRFTAEEIYGPLGMKDTAFNPAPSLRPRIAPTEPRDGVMLRGTVHDPTSFRMGGVAGHAGLFSTADDTAIYAQMILNGGEYGGVRVLSRATVAAMISPQSPPGATDWRGYGWDIDTRFSSNRGDLLPRGSVGHTGFTGTSLWIDPAEDLLLILLTSRLHPEGKGNVVPLRSKVANVVAAAVQDFNMRARVTLEVPPVPVMQSRAGGRPAPGVGRVETGIDVLRSQGFRSLAGKRVGLITNHTGLARDGKTTIDLLHQTPDVRLVALFSPEHGIRGLLDANVPSSVDETTGLPIHSLYGDSRRPTAEALSGIGVLVFDIQDIGSRFYTYISTMGYAMEEAAKRGIRFVVLDRPNVIGAVAVEGPILDAERLSFTGYFPMPIRHGMTVGELARLFNEENRIGVELEVVPVRGWNRGDLFDRTGLLWVNPSPNMRSLTQAILYPGIGTLETTNLSVGRGTDTPFEVVGAPWIDGRRLSDELNGRGIPGVRFLPIRFTPRASVFANQECQGINIVLTDRESFPSVLCGLEIAAALHKLFPEAFEIDEYLRLMGNQETLQRLKEGEDARVIAAGWKDGLDRFRQLRQKYLIY